MRDIQGMLQWVSILLVGQKLSLVESFERETANHMMWYYGIPHYDVTSYSLNDVKTSQGDICLQTALFYE